MQNASSRHADRSALFSRILVPLDGSEIAEKALPYARHLAHLDHGELHLIYITPYILADGGIGAIGVGAYPIAPELLDNEMTEHKLYLAKIKAPLEQDGFKVFSHTSVGDPVVQILEQSTRLDCKLIVLTSHGREGVNRILWGSVAEQLARQAPCPVMIVGRQSIEDEEAQSLFNEEALAS